MILWLARLPVMHQQTKFERGCQLRQQLSLVQFFGEWENLRLQYKTEWDCFRFVMFLIPASLFLVLALQNNFEMFLCYIQLLF